MKTVASLLSLVATAAAFPALAEIESLVSKRQTADVGGNCGEIPCLTFDPKEQYVNVEPNSPNQYVAPGVGDIRGPCPGLNAAANHGFLSHSGVTTIAETVNGLGAAYGLSADAAGFLAVYAVAISGDPASGTWSIGGPYAGSAISAVSGAPEGISYSHNNYEGDSSVTRADAYVNNGDAHSLQLDKFTRMSLSLLCSVLLVLNTSY